MGGFFVTVWKSLFVAEPSKSLHPLFDKKGLGVGLLHSFIVHMSLLVHWNVIMLDVRMSTKIVSQASTCDAREGFIIPVEDKVAKIKRKAVPEKKTDN